MDYKVQALVLFSREIREYDRLYRIFSRERGYQTVLGIGTRKTKAKLAGGLEPLTESEVFLLECRKLDRVRGVIVEEYFPNLKQSLEALTEARRELQALARLFPEGEPNEDFFEALKAYLSFLDNWSKSCLKNWSKESKQMAKESLDRLKIQARIFRLGLFWKALAWNGYQPELFICRRCRAELKGQLELFFFPPGGAFCQNCGIQKQKENRLFVRISPDTVKLLRIFFDYSHEIFLKLKVNSRIIAQVERVTKAMIESVE